MAQVTYRGNLSAKVFPFVADYFGATVVIPGPDQNFNRQVVSPEDLDKDTGIPQLYYCHNVMPSSEGFQSIGYDTKAAYSNPYPGFAGFQDIFLLRDTLNREMLFSHAVDGTNLILYPGGGQWATTNMIAGAGNVGVSTATLNGQTYIYFSGVGCFMYDYDNNALIEVTLNGLNKNQVKGITSNSGYMIAWGDSFIAWSSTIDHLVPTDPIDFAPSLVTGAGGGNVESVKGKITFCIPHLLGFIIYTSRNAVAAVYSGNSRYPFTFREIVNAGGMSNPALVALDSNSGNHYAYTTSGIQLVSISQTQTLYPEVTDFLAGQYFEDFDETTLQFIRYNIGSPMNVAISMIADRYLVISYGVSGLTHALVYDTVQKRFGKLKIPHVVAFEWSGLDATANTPRKSLGFLQADGTIKTVNFNYNAANSSGLMLLGKYQLVRTRLLEMQEVEIENVPDKNNFSLYLVPSIDGKTLQSPILGTLAGDFGAAKKYTFRATGINHTIIAKGSFKCSSIVLKFHIHGRR